MSAQIPHKRTAANRGADGRVEITEGTTSSYSTASRAGCTLAVPPALEQPAAGTMTRTEYLAWMGR